MSKGPGRNNGNLLYRRNSQSISLGGITLVELPLVRLTRGVSNFGMTEALRVHVQPLLRQSTLVLAFRGWNDAGEAASTALHFLDQAIQSVPLADIDPDEFYDFTVLRPEVFLGTEGRRQIRWPSLEFRYGSADSSREVVTGIGPEPHMRWRSYCDCVAALCGDFGLNQVVLLGAYLADVVYSRPVQVTGFATDSTVLSSLGVTASGYEGPTGIVGVLAERLEREGACVASLWAGLPHYIQAAPNSRGALALIQKLTTYLDIKLDDEPLRQGAAEFEQRIAQMVNEDADLTAYVKQLKRRDFEQ